MNEKLYPHAAGGIRFSSLQLACHARSKNNFVYSHDRRRRARFAARFFAAWAGGAPQFIVTVVVTINSLEYIDKPVDPRP